MNSTTIKQMYDEIIAQNYQLDKFGLLSESREIIINQIKKYSLDLKVNSIFDFALGTGDTLLILKDIFPDANLYGIDISQKMLDIAKDRMEVTTFHDDVRNVENYHKSNSIDLILIHFLLAYVEPEIVISAASKLLKQGGVCSIATSTYDSFQKLQTLASQFLSQEQIKLKAKVPDNPDTLDKMLAMLELKSLDTYILKKKVVFDNFEELYKWGMNSGWLTQYFCELNNDTIQAVSDISGLFPLEDEFQAIITLAQKI